MFLGVAGGCGLETCASSALGGCRSVRAAALWLQPLLLNTHHRNSPDSTGEPLTFVRFC
jgi:hypothetical protein